MEKKYGISMKEEEEDSGSGLSKGIQNVTENTANLLASYINAIRADVVLNGSMCADWLKNCSRPIM